MTYTRQFLVSQPRNNPILIHLTSPVCFVPVCNLLNHVFVAGIEAECAGNVLPLDSLGIIPGV